MSQSAGSSGDDLIFCLPSDFDRDLERPLIIPLSHVVSPSTRVTLLKFVPHAIKERDRLKLVFESHFER